MISTTIFFSYSLVRSTNTGESIGQHIPKHIPKIPKKTLNALNVAFVLTFNTLDTLSPGTPHGTNQ